MRVSVALATYNGEKYLFEQLNSIKNQKYLPFELVICDDKSTDDTLSIIKSFSKTAPFEIRVCQNKKNLGYAGNFDKAISMASGDLVFLSDQDDVWFPEKIETIVRIANSNPKALVIMNDAVLTNAELQNTGLTKLSQIRSAGFSDSNFVMGCCAAVRRELLDICLPIPHQFTSHDDWIVRIADELGRKMIVNDILQYYRRHGKNASSFIVNRTTRVTKLDVKISKWKKTFRQSLGHKKSNLQSYQRKIPFHELLLNWLNNNDIHINKSFESEIIKLRIRLENYSQAFTTRENLKRASFFIRIIKVIVFLRSGGYRHFSGAKSAVKDLLYPSV